jgi:hypothetical protein
MKTVFMSDPVLWLLVAGILFGLAILVWALGVLKNDHADDGELRSSSFDFLPPLQDQQPPKTESTDPAPDFQVPSLTAELQTIESKPAQAYGETLEKLIRIVGTVLQQVEILQKQMNNTKQGPPK